MLRAQISISEQVNDLSLKAALLFTWMIPHTDDFGRMLGSPKKVKAIVVPLREDFTSKDVDDALNEMHKIGLICRYKLNDESYIQFIKFETHQQGLHKRTKSKIPPPEEGNSIESSESFPEVPGNSAPELELELEKNTIQTTDVVCCASTNDENEKISIPKEKNNVPCQRIFELYHEILPIGLRAKKLTDKRKAVIKARWNESKLHQNEQFWITFFNQVANSNFLTGKIYNQQKGPFILTFDKILRPGMFTQIIDGYYNRDSNGRPTENLFD